MAVIFEKTKGLTDAQTHYCPGCTHGIIHRLVAEVLEEMDVVGSAIGVAPVGCSVLAYNYFNCDMHEAAHGRAPACATGIKRVNPNNTVFTYQGDGDLAAGGDGNRLAHFKVAGAVGTVGAPRLPVLQLVAGVAVGVERRVLLALVPAQGPGKSLGPGLNIAAHLAGRNGQLGGKGLSLLRQVDAAPGYLQRSGLGSGGGQHQQRRQHRQHQQQGHSPHALGALGLLSHSSFLLMNDDTILMQPAFLLFPPPAREIGR